MVDTQQWMLRVPFEAPALTFIEEQTVEGSELVAHIQPGTAPYSRLVVNELSSIEQVHTCFITLKRALLAASLNLNCGIRVQGDLVVIANDDPLPTSSSQPFACRQGRNLRQLLLTFGQPTFQLERAWPQLLQGLQAGLAGFGAGALRDKDVALACDLYLNSHFESSDAARFITLIGALEVIKDRGSASKETVHLVDRWVRELDQLSEPEAISLRGSLAYLKRLSITRGIGTLVARHLNEDRSRQACNLYNIRSKLVHDGIHPDDFNSVMTLASDIVRELLAAILEGGAR